MAEPSVNDDPRFPPPSEYLLAPTVVGASAYDHETIILRVERHRFRLTTDAADKLLRDLRAAVV